MSVYRYLPNAVTISRFPLALLFVYGYATANVPLGLSAVAAGCISDWLDGYLARRWGVQSELGKVLDAYADKWICWVMTGVAFHILGPHPILVLVAVVVCTYDTGLTVVRYALENRTIPVNQYARAKTMMLMLGLILVYIDAVNDHVFGTTLRFLAYSALTTAMLLALASMRTYVRSYKLEWLIPYPFRLLL